MAKVIHSYNKQSLQHAIVNFMSLISKREEETGSIGDLAKRQTADQSCPNSFFEFILPSSSYSTLKCTSKQYLCIILLYNILYKLQDIYYY